MYKKITIDIELNLEELEFLSEDLEEKLYESISDAIEDFSPEDRNIKITIE